jgi:hypothetical protein
MTLARVWRRWRRTDDASFHQHGAEPFEKSIAGTATYGRLSGKMCEAIPGQLRRLGFGGLFQVFGGTRLLYG